MILSWFQEQLLEVTINSLLDIFLNGEAIIGIIKRYRNDLVEHNSHQREDHDCSGINNQCAFQILKDEYNIPVVSLYNFTFCRKLDVLSLWARAKTRLKYHSFQIFDGESSMNVTTTHLPECIEYLSQIYNVFKGEIPKPEEQLKQVPF